MRRTALLGCLVLGLSGDPLRAQAVDAAARDMLADQARRFASCVLELDADCVYAMTDVETLVAAGVRTPYVDRQVLRALWRDQPADNGDSGSGLANLEEATSERVTHFEALDAGEPFPVDSKLYAFVPFYQTNTTSAGRIERNGFLIAVSANGGGTWRFNIINGLHIQGQHVARLYPDLAGQRLPPMRNDFVPRPGPVRTPFLTTTDGRFVIGAGGAAYAMRYEVGRAIAADVTLIASFDNPATPGRPLAIRGVLPGDQETLEIRSPPLTGFVPGEEYAVVVHAFSQATGEQLFEHRQPLLFDPTREMWALLSSIAGAAAGSPAP